MSNTRAMAGAKAAPWPLIRAVTVAQVIRLLACLLVFKTVLSVWGNYPDYFPPDFRAVFLLGRERYFFGAYQWAFYAHILVGPLVLLTGLALISSRLRRRFPDWHRSWGKIHVACVVFLLCPSGLWLARYAMAGAPAAVSFALLSCATAGSAVMGWRAAIRRQMERHRRWMLRCFALLCSAVVIRVLGGGSEVLGLEESYPISAWISWLAPLIFLESSFIIPRMRSRLRRLSRAHGE